MKRPKIYVEKYNKVFDVQEIHFDIDVVCFDNGQPDFAQFEFEDVEFMENTDLKDKNGKYIYVGDIVSFKDSHFDGYNFTNFAVMRKNIKLYLENFLCVQSCIKEEMAEMYLEVHDFEEGYFEVVGNIYENKDLLEE